MRTYTGRRGFCLGLTLACGLAFAFASHIVPFVDVSVRARAAAEEKTQDEKAGKIIPFKGTLYLIGGGANQSLDRFVELAGGKKAKIVIIPHASSQPQEAADSAANLFAARGVKNIVTIMPGQSGIGLPKDVSGVYLTGGDQNRLVRLLDKTLAGEISDYLMNGGLVGGTSAGAAAAAKRMIAGGMDDSLIKSGSLLLGDGLGYLPEIIVDTHVLQRARHDRLLVAITLVSGTMGIGLDEDTAVEISGERLRVWGVHHVRIVQRSEKHSSNLASVDKGAKANVQNVIYSVLSEGDEWKF